MNKLFRNIFVLLNFIFLILSPTVFAQTINDLTNTNGFSDVLIDNPYYVSVSYLQENGWISGYDDHTFKPYQTINRAEFVKIVEGIDGYNPGQDPSGFDIYSLSGIPFKDVESKEWYVPYLRRAIQDDFIAGYPDNTFRPANEISFVEAAKILAKLNELPTTSIGGAWYRDYVKAMENAYAIPMTINSLNQKISRGEMAEMILRLSVKKDGLITQTLAVLEKAE